MRYKVYCSGVSHVGYRRSLNQDNFIYDGRYMETPLNAAHLPFAQYSVHEHPLVVGIFDGMGGEEHGEIASRIAAQEASRIKIAGSSTDALLIFCTNANERICQYADEHAIKAMGTTAALLVFTEDVIALCNIGDSKVFRFDGKTLEQLSKDHISVAAHGMKPPLSQNLGIAPSEMIIDPYVAVGQYHAGDMYLICSDGLTDMLKEEEITEVLCDATFNDATDILLENALANGGKDNITIILCQVARERKLFKRLFGRKGRSNDG